MSYDLFILHGVKDGSVDGDKGHPERGQELKEAAAGRPDAPPVEVVFRRVHERAADAPAGERPVRLAYKLYFLSERTIFFSHNKSTNSTFSHSLSVKRTGQKLPMRWRTRPSAITLASRCGGGPPPRA